MRTNKGGRSKKTRQVPADHCEDWLQAPIRFCFEMCECIYISLVSENAIHGCCLPFNKFLSWEQWRVLTWSSWILKVSQLALHGWFPSIFWLGMERYNAKKNWRINISKCSDGILFYLIRWNCLLNFYGGFMEQCNSFLLWCILLFIIAFLLEFPIELKDCLYLIYDQ
jgi:hypothetical protein